MNVLQIQPSEHVNRANVMETLTAVSALENASTVKITPPDFTVTNAATERTATQLLLTAKVAIAINLVQCIAFVM